MGTAAFQMRTLEEHLIWQAGERYTQTVSNALALLSILSSSPGSADQLEAFVNSIFKGKYVESELWH